MIYEAEARQWLRLYLEGGCTLDEFEDWLVVRSWNMHLDSDQSAQDLVGALELALSEFSSGDIGQPELNERFQELAE